MNIFVYGDESGVFDRKHNEIFVFGGLIFLDKESRDTEYRKYIAAERKISSLYEEHELKASILKPKHRASLFRSMNRCLRYAFVIDQQRVNENIFNDKKSKQRYLDYVFKVGLKRVFRELIESGMVDVGHVENIYVRFDEHTTATNGRYELREGMEAEFKRGTMNYEYNVFHPPVFPNMKGCVELQLKDSKADSLIRASDIIANRAFFYARKGRDYALSKSMHVVKFP